MKILFLTIGRMESIENKGLYTDLLRCFREKGHEIYTVSPYQRRENKKTSLIKENQTNMLHVKIGNITKCSIIEKGISTILIETQFIKAIKKYFKDVKFDLVIYTTPPITFAKVIKYVKKRDNAKTYLLLKDIFPQNAVDIGMMKKNGVKSIIYKFFRRKEKVLYKISDKIGCMSQANIDFVLGHNPEVNPENIHICPNAIEVEEYDKDLVKRKEIREKWNIPEDKTVFIYGGNLGKPQGIPFLIECLKENKNKDDRFFVICGKGTEYGKLLDFYEAEKPENMLLINGLPKEEYDEFVKAFDVGLIFLDHRFTIPNFPSRLLSYMQTKMPVLACTDPNTDVGRIAEAGGFGFWCESNDSKNFTLVVDKLLSSDLEAMGNIGYEYLKENYTAEKACNTILSNI